MSVVRERERERERDRERETETETERDRDRQTDRQRERQRDRERQRQIHGTLLRRVQSTDAVRPVTSLECVYSLRTIILYAELFD